MNSSPFYAWGYFLISSVTQIGSCAVIGPLSFEAGTYFQIHRGEIERELDSNNINYDFGPIRKLSLALNCSDKGSDIFIKSFVEKQDEILGPNREYIARTVMKNSIKMIRNDAFLSKECHP